MARFRFNLKPAAATTPAGIPDPGKPISVQRKLSGTRIALILFGAFILMGSLFSYLFVIRPYLLSHAARDWVAVPCTIISSEVGSHRGDDSTTYSVDITYTYQFNGGHYTSDRYDFVLGTSSGHREKARIVARYPVGSDATCFVNPLDPAQAVIERRILRDRWSAFVLIFPLVGVAGIVVTLVGARRLKAREAQAISAATPTLVAGRPAVQGFERDTGPVTLKSSGSRVGGFLVLLLFSGFWNGMVFGLLVPQALREGIGLKLFAIPFVLVGVATAGGVVYLFLGLFNARATVTVSQASVRLGEGVRVNWQLTGGVRPLERLRVYLEAREESTYRRGTNTHTDKHVFHTIDLADEDDPARMISGEAYVLLPPDSMHSFEAKNNKIIWSLHLHGQVPLWPDVKQEFPLRVLPLAPASGFAGENSASGGSP